MKALITGITGQDGSYLAEILYDKGYDVYGVIRRSSSPNTQRIDHIFKPEEKGKLFYGDLADGIGHILYKVQPDEVYNLASMSHVRISFDIPIYTTDITALGPARILEDIMQGVHQGYLSKDIRFYQASSSEMFGTAPPPQNEDTPFQPVSPYGCSKLYAYHITRAYRTGYNLFACNGILFNHESPRRGVNFVTKKIVSGAVRIKQNKQKSLKLGNLDALRDWGHSKDYMRAIYLIMQQPRPGDYVVGTGKAYSVKEFCQKVFDALDMNWRDHVIIDSAYTRPNEVPVLISDPRRIKQLGWKPEYDIDKLIQEMIDHEFNQTQR